MKIKKEYILLAVIIIALSVYLYMRNTDKTHYTLPVLPEVNGKDISKIEIIQSEKAIILSNTDGEWKIEPNQYIADSKKVKEMVDILENLTLSTLVSESKSYNRYDLHEDKKISIKAWSGEIVSREFDIGKTASSNNHTFVKLSDDPRVFHARENFRKKFDQIVENLRDKSVLTFEKNEIQEIHLTKGETSLVLSLKQSPIEITPVKEETSEGKTPEKTEPIWLTADGKKGDKTKINSLLSTLSSLTCEKYIEDKKKEDLLNPICTLLVKGPQEYSISIFEKPDKETNNHPAVSSENDYPFWLSDWRAKKILINPDEILEKPKDIEPAEKTRK